MDILVTGGTGFTGYNLAKKLKDSGNNVKVLARKTSDTVKLKDLGIDIITGDISDPGSVEKAVKGSEIVYNIAAAYREANLPDNRYWEVNLNGTKNILESSVRNNVKRLIHCSTIGLVSSVKVPPEDESCPYSPDDVYQRSKCEAEKTVLNAVKEGRIKASVIRPCAIYGPGDMRLLKIFKMVAEKKFIFLGNGKALFHMVYIDDLVQGLMLAAKKDEAVGGVFIVGHKRYTTLEELTRIIAKEFGVKPPRIHVPYWPVEKLSVIVEKLYRILDLKKDPPIYKRRVAFYKKNRAFSIQKAEKILGYKPGFSLEEGIHITAQWYIKKGFIDIAGKKA